MAWLTRDDPSASTRRLTSVRVRSWTFFAARRALHVKSGEYFAPIGQIGAHVSLRQHGGRPPYDTEFFAEGWPHMVMPAFSTQSLSKPRL